jgi:hypothetical protein
MWFRPQTTSSNSSRCWQDRRLARRIGRTRNADTGYFSAANVEVCAAAGIEPLIAMGRQPHHPPLTERFETAPPSPGNSTPVEAIAHQLRKQTREPVFGIIISVLGFRQFSLRGLD